MYRIMMIDDEYAIHLSLRKLVERSGLRIEVAGEAGTGLKPWTYWRTAGRTSS